MKDFENDMPIDIQLNNENNGKGGNLVEENQLRDSNATNIINNNIDNQNDKKDNKNLDASKIDDTNLHMPVNNSGLFNQKIELENNDTVESNKMTLDEPVLESLKRDLFRIYNKLKHVVTPRLT